MLIVLLAATLENHLISFVLAVEIFPDISVRMLCCQQLSVLG